MKEFVPVVTVFLSGLFALVVAFVTSSLGNRKDRKGRQKQAAQDAYEEMKAAYTSSFISLEKALRAVERDADFPVLEGELAVSNARLQLLASPEILEQNQRVSETLFAWSTEYRRGEPKKLGQSGISIISSQDGSHQQKAKELYPDLMTACSVLVNLMRTDLEKLKGQVAAI